MEKVENTYRTARASLLRAGGSSRASPCMHQWDVIAPSVVVVMHDGIMGGITSGQSA